MPPIRKHLPLLIEILALLAILLAIAIIFIYYNQLPDKIPSHFSFSGKPDTYSGKQSIWILPIMAVIIYLVLSSLALLIRMLKRPDELTSEVLMLVLGMIRALKLIFSFLNLYLVAGTVLISLGRAEGLGAASTPVFLVVIASVLIFNILRIARKQKSVRS